MRKKTSQAFRVGDWVTFQEIESPGVFRLLSKALKGRRCQIIKESINPPRVDLYLIKTFKKDRSYAKDKYNIEIPSTIWVRDELLILFQKEESRGDYYKDSSGFNTSDSNWDKGLGLI